MHCFSNSSFTICLDNSLERKEKRGKGKEGDGMLWKMPFVYLGGRESRGRDIAFSFRIFRPLEKTSLLTKLWEINPLNPFVPNSSVPNPSPRIQTKEIVSLHIPPFLFLSF